MMRSLKSVGGMTGPGIGIDDEANRNLWFLAGQHALRQMSKLSTKLSCKIL